MASHRVNVAQSVPLFFLIGDAIAFWLRNQFLFWLLALPIAGLAAAGTYLSDQVQQFAFLRRPEGWHFLFALIYALFLDRWIKESLLEEAAPCEEVDALRHALVPPPLLLLAIVFFVFAVGLSWLRLHGVEDEVRRWLPLAPGVILGTLLSWLPHLLAWATAFGLLALLMPAWCAGVPLSFRQAWAASASARPRLLRLFIGSVVLSMLIYAVTLWAGEALPARRWVPAALAGGQRLADCLLLAVVGHVLAALFVIITGWQQPEPEDRPFRNMGMRSGRA
jgi:hypothetical protein